MDEVNDINDVEVILDENSEVIVEDSDDEDEDYYNYPTEHNLDKNIFQRLKQNDPSVTNLSLSLNCDDDGKYYFNSIDWKEDGDCIANNTHIKKIHISYDGARIWWGFN